MKELAYRVFVDIWRLACKYRFQKLDDPRWESLIEDAGRLLERYKGTDAEYLFRSLFAGVQSFYERMQSESEEKRF